MNLKNGSNAAAALLLSFAIAFGLTGCGSSDQSNPPLVSTNSVVELVSSSLQYNAAGTTISGTITTSYPTTLSGVAALSGFSADITGCSVSTVTVGTGNTITYTDNNNIISNVEITLASSCSSTSVTLSATETNDANTTSSWNKTASVSAAAAGEITSPIATIVADTATQNIELTQNNESRQIVLKVYDINNGPVSGGTISVRYPNEVLTGVDVGTLAPVDSAEIQNGEAVFNYTGPSDLISLINSGHTNTVFTFFDTLNPTKSVNVTIAYNPDTTTPPPLLTGYTVDFISSNQEATTNLDTTAVFTLSVKDDNGKLIANEDLNSTDITSMQPNLVRFIDATGAEVDTLHFDGKNNIAMTIKTYTVAGLVPFAIALKIKDANGVLADKNVTKSITVFSGPPTAMSISYASTGQDANNVKFIEKMVVSLTDKWNNPVNTQPTIYAGAITGYTVDPTSTVGNQYMIRNTTATAQATVSSHAIGANLHDATGVNFDVIDPYNDVLMTFGNSYSYQASGKWDIDAATGGTDIFMTDTYTAIDPTSNMGYAVGHNHRQDICDFGREWIGQVDSADGTFKVDSTGSVVIDFRYDYQLTGKTVFFGASVVGTLNSANGAEELRMGEAVKHTLRGHGIESPGTYNVPKGFSGTVTFYNFGLTDTAEYLRNAKFSFSQIETTGDVLATYDASSNDVNPVTTRSRIYDCVDDNGADTDGRAWVRYNVTSTEGGTMTLSNGLVVSEF